MPPEVHVTVIGLVVAAIVLAAVVTVLGWMLRVRRPAGGPPAEEETAPVILAPVTRYTPPEVLHLAAMLAAEAAAEVVLLHVIEVPYTLPLDVTMAAPETRGYLREFRRQIESGGVTAEIKVARSRRAGKVIVEMARALRPRAIVLGATPHRGGLGSTVAYVLENAGGSRVLVSKPSARTAAASPGAPRGVASL